MADKENTIYFKCLEVRQPIGNFYIGCITHKDLLNISYSDIREIEDDDIAKYLGIQRPLSESRVKDLKNYVNTFDATFPTAIILSISSNNILSFDGNYMEIKNEPNVAKIIDGQHRIAGLRFYEGNVFEMNVTIFIDMDLSDQATVFSTINLNQTKVNKSLAYDLFELSKTRSPHKTCHNIVKLLNTTEGSPFYRKIKILGSAPKKDLNEIIKTITPTITQATIVEGILQYIDKTTTSKDHGTNIFGISFKPKSQNSRNEKYIFQPFYDNKQDAEIAKVIWNYFSAVSKKWNHAWSNDAGLILNKAAGFNALMKFLKDIYLYYNKYGQILTLKEFTDILKIIDMSDDDFSVINFPSNSSGSSNLYKRLKELSNI